MERLWGVTDGIVRQNGTVVGSDGLGKNELYGNVKDQIMEQSE